MRRWLWLAVPALFVSAAAMAQVPGGAGVQLHGTLTPGDCIVAFGARSVQDGGAPCGAATGVTVGTTTIASGTDKGLLYDNGGVLGNLATANSGVLVTSAAGVPSISTTLPTGLAYGTPASLVGTNITGTAAGLTAGTVTTNANLTGPVTSVGNATSITAGGITLAGLATQATNTVVGNATAGTASPTALAVGTCSTSGSALRWTTNTGFGCNTSIDAATLGGATFAAPGTIGGTTPGVGNFTAVAAGAGSSIGWTGQTLMTSPADGRVLMSNNAVTDFARLMFGGVTSSFPALKRSGTTLAVRLADDSADAPLTASALTLTTPLANASVAATPFPAAGSGATLVAPRSYYECTTTCSITLPTPAAGYEFCVRNANNVSTVITFAGISSVQFEVQAQTSYKTANTSIVSGGAATDKACWIGKDATHYDVGSMVGTWS